VPPAAPVRRLAASAPGAGLPLPGGVAGSKMRETHCWRAEREAAQASGISLQEAT